MLALDKAATDSRDCYAFLLCLAIVDALRKRNVRDSSPQLASQSMDYSDGLERRALQAFFCDLVNSTGGAAAMDPEEWFDAQLSFQRCVVAAVEEHGGTVAQYRGDAIVAYFGYPMASEFDARLAISAALEAVKRIEELAPHYDYTLQCRVGLHCGTVVVGEEGAGLHRERLASGHTLNVAARIQGLAAPGEVLVSDTVLHRIEESFEVEAMEPTPLKGIDQPVTLYRVHGRRRTPPWIRDRISLHGRDEELEALKAHWQACASGAFRATLVTGDAGIGKSRLFRALRDEAFTQERRGSWLSDSCDPFEMQRDFSVFRDLFARNATAFEHSALPAHHRQWLQAFVSGEEFQLGRQLGLTPEQSRARNFALIHDGLAAVAAITPIACVIENLHWADHSSLEALARLITATPRRIALLMNSRQPIPSMTTSNAVQHIALTELDNTAACDLLEAHANALGYCLEEEERERIITVADGIPLFIEQLAYTGREIKPDGLAPHAPLTLQAALLAHLDQLPQERFVAQVASVIGRRFSLAAVQLLSDRDGTEVRAALEALERSAIIERDPEVNTRFAFRHALLQGTAYETLARRRRLKLHGRYAIWLESIRADPAVIAQHFELAEQHKRAARYYKQAGEVAAARSAHKEAIIQLQGAIRELDRASALLPRTELELQLTLASSMLAVRFYTDLSLNEVWCRVQDLAHRSENPDLHVLAAYNASMYWQTRGDWQQSLARAQDIGEIAAATGSKAHHLMAHLAAVLTYIGLGRNEEAYTSARAARAQHDPAHQDFFVDHHGSDLGIISAAWVAITAAIRNLPEVAQHYAEVALKEARVSRHPFTLLYVLSSLAYMGIVQGRRSEAFAWAEESLSLGAHYQLPALVVVANAFAVVADDGSHYDFNASCAALDNLREAAMLATVPGLWAALAERELLAGRPGNALKAVERAKQVSTLCEQPGFQPPIMAIEAVLAILSGEAAEGLTRIKQARALAQAQGAEMLLSHIDRTLAGLGISLPAT